MYNLCIQRGGKGGCVKIHIQIHSVSKNLKPLCTRIIAFTVLNAVKQKSNNRTKTGKKKKKTKQKKPRNCIFKKSPQQSNILSSFQTVSLYIAYLHIRPISLPRESVGKTGVRKPGRRQKRDDDKKVNITEGLCVDGDVPPYRILSYCTRVRNKVLGFHCFASSLPVMSSHVPRSKVDGSLVQMFLVFSCFAFT